MTRKSKRPPSHTTPADASDDSLRRTLQRANDFNRSYGVLTWGKETLEAKDDFRPATQDKPRLFFSYRWGNVELESWLDMLVPSIVAHGYQVVYDRDPRNFGKPLSRDAVLARMDVCNYVIAVIDQGFAKRVASTDLSQASALTHEWEHVLARARQGTTKLCAIWYDGELPKPFTRETVMDMRPLETENLWAELDRYFPKLDAPGAVFAPPFVPKASLGLPSLLQRTGSLVADQYRLVTICAWKADGTCDRLGPVLVRQLERMSAQLAATGKYTRITSEPAGFASSD